MRSPDCAKPKAPLESTHEKIFRESNGRETSRNRGGFRRSPRGDQRCVGGQLLLSELVGVSDPTHRRSRRLGRSAVAARLPRPRTRGAGSPAARRFPRASTRSGSACRPARSPRATGSIPPGVVGGFLGADRVAPTAVSHWRGYRPTSQRPGRSRHGEGLSPRVGGASPFAPRSELASPWAASRSLKV